MHHGFHEDLRGAARWLPYGVGWLAPLLRRVPIPAGRMPPGVQVEEQAVPGSPARVRVYTPTDRTGPLPTLLWIHGGGYIIGSATQDDWQCARFVQRLGVAVASVEYRLAPAHPYPAPLDDCLAALDHVLADPSTFDAGRLVIAGQSAGGGLAAALVLRAHDLGRPAPRLQLLVYPMLDDRTVLRPVDGRLHRLWDQASNRTGWTAYLGRDPGGPDVPDHAAPARRADLAGLPPAWIGVGTCDLFHDEDVDYARRLRAAGVPVTLDVIPGAFHGFDTTLPGRGVSRSFFESQVRAIEAAIR